MNRDSVGQPADIGHVGEPVEDGDSLEMSSLSPAQTQRLAGRLASVLRSGDVVLLGGDLGAGKTTFTQGLARGLGVTEVVSSPTFTLVRSYDTDAGFELLHADVYRLEQLHEVIDLALPEQLEAGACAVIEWGERAQKALGPDYLDVRLDYGGETEERIITFSPMGPAWADRQHELVGAVSP